MDGLEVGIVALLAGAWLLQIWLSTSQMRRYHKETQEIRRLGTYMATGIAGNMYRRKVYATVVADEGGIVRAAQALSGFTVFAQSRRVPEVVGLPIASIGKGAPPEGVNEKTWNALGHAAGFIVPKVSARTLEGAFGPNDEEDSGML